MTHKTGQVTFKFWEKHEVRELRICSEGHLIGTLQKVHKIEEGAKSGKIKYGVCTIYFVYLVVVRHNLESFSLSPYL
jgi:hypothetical protein